MSAMVSAIGDSVPAPDVQKAAHGIKSLASNRKYHATNGQKTLAYYAELGDIVLRLDNTFGKRAVKALAEIVDEEGLRHNTLYKAARFAKMIEANLLDLQILESNGVSWRAASMLTSENLTAARRSKILDDLNAKKISPAKLGRLITSKLASAATSTSRSVTTAFDRASAAIALLRRARDEGSDTAMAALTELKTLLEQDIP